MYIQAQPARRGSQNENPRTRCRTLSVGRHQSRRGRPHVQYNPASWFNLQGLANDRRQRGLPQFNEQGVPHHDSTPRRNGGSNLQSSTDRKKRSHECDATLRHDLPRRPQGTPELAVFVRGSATARSRSARANTLAVRRWTSLAMRRRISGGLGCHERQRDRFIAGAVSTSRTLRSRGLSRDGSSLYGAGNRWQTSGRARDLLVMRERGAVQQVTEFELAHRTEPRAGCLPL